MTKIKKFRNDVGSRIISCGRRVRNRLGAAGYVGALFCDHDDDPNIVTHVLVRWDDGYSTAEPIGRLSVIDAADDPANQMGAA